MSIEAVSVIDIGATSADFSVLDEALGKCGLDPLEVRIQDDLKSAIARKAREEGFKNSSEAVRFVLAKWTLGDDVVESLIAQVMARYRMPGATCAPGAVPTAAGQGSGK